MKRPATCENPVVTSSDDSSSSNSDDDDDLSKPKSGKEKTLKGSEANIRKKKLGGMDYEALSKHGYRGGPSVLKIPPPRAVGKEQDWSWSTGKEGNGNKNSTEEPFEEQQRTRAAALGEQLLKVQPKLELEQRDKKKASFSQKEKRKRDLGQASRGKNYVEEEKRLLRDSGIYSGFDS
ncbi:hypothetical protein AXF42_Ash014272 [Apostasia shenzhenica]|uniref:Uncharacterized protein n=1 Tax=Apostasia shenzhenica TaxID=1088818 RepID=A0A2I0A1E5_9ASPA|nr:hypothetical protein AXF42_Ash014272 [Apostasia shenzhenica]